jgi:hypothetical protein
MVVPPGHYQHQVCDQPAVVALMAVAVALVIVTDDDEKVTVEVKVVPGRKWLGSCL